MRQPRLCQRPLGSGLFAAAPSMSTTSRKRPSRQQPRKKKLSKAATSIPIHGSRHHAFTAASVEEAFRGCNLHPYTQKQTSCLHSSLRRRSFPRLQPPSLHGSRHHAFTADDIDYWEADLGLQRWRPPQQRPPLAKLLTAADSMKFSFTVRPLCKGSTSSRQQPPV